MVIMLLTQQIFVFVTSSRTRSRGYGDSPLL